MKSVAQAVKKLVSQDEVAVMSLRRGVLNLSAYAEELLPKVEKECWKEVKKGTVVVALSRLLEELEELPNPRPEIILDELSIRSPLVDISFEKTKSSLASLEKVLKLPQYRENSFFMFTEGLKELTLIFPGDLQEKVLALFNQEPKALYEDLVGISARFSPEYLKVPNIIYVMLGELAIRNINLVEVVSTYTELTIVVKRDNSQEAISALQSLLATQEK